MIFGLTVVSVMAVGMWLLLMAVTLCEIADEKRYHERKMFGGERKYPEAFLEYTWYQHWIAFVSLCFLVTRVVG